jgi:hypothetical protein
MRTSKNIELPADLAQAINAAEAVLVKYGTLEGAMIQTGRSIPAALAEERQLNDELGRAEIQGGDTGSLHQRLDATRGERASAARRRLAASDCLLQLDAELEEARQAVDRARSVYAVGVVAEFSGRWAAKIRELAALRAEAAELSRVLGCSVPTPSYLSEAPAPAESVQLPTAVEAIAAVLQKLEAARVLCASVRQSHNFTRTFFARARERGARGEFGGVFQVTRTFEVLGSVFSAGQLVDRSVLLGEGLVERFFTGRQLQPVSEGAARAAA